MKLLINKFAFMTLAVICMQTAHSQNYLGVINSNYSGIMGADLQPASIVDNRFAVDVNLFSLNVDVWQNAKNFNASNLPNDGWWLTSLIKDPQTWSDGIDFENSISDVANYDSPNAKSRGVYLGTQLDVMSFMFHIRRDIAVGFSAKMRFIANVDDIHPELGRLAEEGLDYSPLWNKQIDGSLLSQTHMSWAEYGFNYAQVLADKDEHFFKMGGRVKVLQGISANYLHAGDLDFELLNKDTATTLVGNFNYGYSDNIDEYISGGNQFNFNDFYRLTSKLGVGADIGFVYEWRPNWKEYKYDMDGEENLWRRDTEKYKLRVGASLLDVGGMKFNKAGKSRDFNVNTTNLDLGVFESTDGFGSFTNIVDSLIQNDPGWTANEDTLQTFFMNLPTALSFQADYHIWKSFYVNAMAYINLNNSKNATNVRMPSTYAITPSFDYKFIGLGVPLSYNTYSGARVGLGARLGPITVGVPDLKTIFPRGKVRGAGFYFGVRVPILYGHPSDSDNDKVSDKLDQCAEIPGVWAFRGCPDTDVDGIPDSEDECPFEVGLPEFGGCPDRDGDGIPDKDDECPDEPGLKEFNGCPDTDGDGIPDKEDECPNEAGTEAFNGCPDRDGDGIPDHKDACPDAPGPVEYDGCPDTDGDGVLDFLDECPEIPGPSENNGCPWPDTDGDGVLDKDDKCPNIAGPAKNEGCPYTDTDNDGVPDKDDKCPETPGPKENEGCPEIEEEVQEILKTAFENLEFETGRSIIKQESVESLNELAEVLVKKPEWGLQIAGHTDNVGKAQSNLILSKQRAEAVRDFMVDRGIAIERLSVLYFGQTMPIQSNDTTEGRQANRRVEMTIILK
jgi:outer membrane protein OmpA-like peptidoglycan-associated protein